MYTSLGTVQLKTGQVVEAGVVNTPDKQWSDRLFSLLGHKGDMWDEQNKMALTEDLGLEMRYYILHCEGKPFCNTMIAESAGVGLLGHVWTTVEYRRQGAASHLFQKIMAHRDQLDTEMIALATEYESVAYHLYERYGFKPIEPNCGRMTWYAHSSHDFEPSFFAAGPTEIVPLNWRHWPSSIPLCMGNWPSMVRLPGAGLIGRRTGEHAVLPLIFANNASDGETPVIPRAMALVHSRTQAVCGLACWSVDRMWPETCVIDLFCHPDYWQRGGELLQSLVMPDHKRLIAYCDEKSPQCRAVLEQAGFTQTGSLDQQAPTHTNSAERLNVAVLTRSD